MWKAGLDQSQVEIKIIGRNINNLRYANDTTLMAESEEELKSFLMKVKEENEKASLKLNIQKLKIMASGPITSWQIDGEKMETVTGFFLGSKVIVDGIKDSVLKNRDITLLTKVHVVNAIDFSNSHVWMWELDRKEDWASRVEAFKL